MPGSSDFDFSDPDLVSVYDEIPLWSAPFGLKLLDAVRFRRGIAALDIGCGTGFPLLDLAQRLGESCHVTGLDPWDGGLDRARMKIRKMNIRNVTVVAGTAETMPFPDGSFDLVVSNNGINNVGDPDAAMRECARVSRPGAQLVMTVNLPDTMKEFYDIFARALQTQQMPGALAVMQEHIHAKRKPAAETAALIVRSGYRVEKSEHDVFTLHFADGTALFNHFFIRLAFLEPWKDVVPPQDAERVFRALEEALNLAAENAGGLRLTVPYLCLSAIRNPV
jgi:arsenite methyltransferase